jgi:hypothetical protein
MENYKNKLQKRKVGFMCTAMIAFIIYILTNSTLIINSQSSSISEDRITSFSAGIITSLGLISIAKVMQLRAILKDEKLIKLQYNKEHDERQQAIKVKAGMPMIMIMSIAMIIASIIGSYFSDVVFYTLFIAGSVQLFAGLIVKFYFSKRM